MFRLCARAQARLATPCTASVTRSLHTKKPLYFSGSNRHARDHKIDAGTQKSITESAAADKKGSELIDTLGSNKSKPATVISSKGKKYNIHWGLHKSNEQWGR